ncbi:longitudinals lacking protein, isoforms N/O/W/X/Y isoform X2 [Hyalella azteca]|uniref:Longitudinals lacking protein, isoforms N/O/W/X/Y isoform X2 n=1 Tax=Hyalella azteca TaxID=294128 RepID=A0A8B7NRY7_HYAAZ|nr:longitudinals lacking protein, isoforms N/O/W/X/Y isoform X2 [Hyalella azteca]
MSLGGLLSLKWNNHCSTFLHILSNLHRKQNYDDATVACDGKLYPVHKLVLSTCSEYFEEMFEKTHGKHPVIVLKDIKKEVFEALLKYMYIGEVNVVQEKLAELINAAECLKIKGLAVPDEEPEQLQLGTRNKSNHLSSYSSNQQNSSGNYLNDEHQSANRSLKNTSSSNFSNKRKDFSNLSNINTPPRKIIRASPNVASKNDLAYDSQSKPIQSSDPQESPSRERRGSLASPLSSRSSLDERPPLPTPTSAPSNEDEEIAAWPMAIKDEPTDEPQSEANEGSGACATEFLDRNNGDCKEDEGGAGSAEDALPALPDPAGGEPSGDSQGAAHKDPSDLIDSKVEVGDIEEAPDDWESSLLNKDDEGQEGEALTSMLSGDDASNAAADTPTPGMRRRLEPHDTACTIPRRPTQRCVSSLEALATAPDEGYGASLRGYHAAEKSARGSAAVTSSKTDRSSQPSCEFSSEKILMSIGMENYSSSTGGAQQAFGAENKVIHSDTNVTSATQKIIFETMSIQKCEQENDGQMLGSEDTQTSDGIEILEDVDFAETDSPSFTTQTSVDASDFGRNFGFSLHPNRRYHESDRDVALNVAALDEVQRNASTFGGENVTASAVFYCDFCSYQTTNKFNLSRHRKRHTGEKPFSCNFCSYRSIEKKSLVFHIYNKHNIVTNSR